MEANGLRIGNIVLLNNRINTIDISWFECCKDSMYGRDIRYDTSPIPLTEEWVIKLGFKEIIDKSGQYVLLNEDYYNIGLEIMFGFRTDNKMLVHLNNQDFNQLIYVHQLQNLYFALTGEELTIHA